MSSIYIIEQKKNALNLENLNCSNFVKYRIYMYSFSYLDLKSNFIPKYIAKIKVVSIYQLLKDYTEKKKDT